jgi:hypothetical protein
MKGFYMRKEKPTILAITPEYRASIIAAAKEIWQYEDVKVPHDAAITFGTNGAWVSAIVWVPSEKFQTETTRIK